MRSPVDGYRGYSIQTHWVDDHWIHRVLWFGTWVDTFLSLDDAKDTIDGWLNAA